MSSNTPTGKRERQSPRQRRGSSVDAGIPFALLGTAPSMQRLLLYFVIRPRARPHLRLLQRELQIGSASIQRDLARLTSARILRPVRDQSSRATRYAVAPHPFWEIARALVAASFDPVALLRAALRDVSGLDAAFLFGSSAAGTAAPDSDLDVFVLGDHVDTRALYGNLFEVGHTLNRQVNALRYTRVVLAQRLAAGGEFPRCVLREPKVWLAGDLQTILPIATAARVRFLADTGGTTWP